MNFFVQKMQHTSRSQRDHIPKKIFGVLRVAHRSYLECAQSPIVRLRHHFGRGDLNTFRTQNDIASNVDVQGEDAHAVEVFLLPIHRSPARIAVSSVTPVISGNPLNSLDSGNPLNSLRPTFTDNAVYWCGFVTISCTSHFLTSFARAAVLHSYGALPLAAPGYEQTSLGNVRGRGPGSSRRLAEG